MLADLFEMQDEIVARLASQLGARLVEAEARRAERSPDPDSVDLYFRAKALINRGSTTEYLKPAEALLQRALQLDPNNVDALAAKGWVDMDFGAGFMATIAPPAWRLQRRAQPRRFLWRPITLLRTLCLARSTVLSIAATKRLPNLSMR